MVNVNKNIVPGKPVESSAKSKAPARRPRNQDLNSSKKPLSGKISTAARNPFLRKLNSSKLAGSTFAGKTYDEARNVLMSDEYGYDMLWDYFEEYMPKLGEEVGKQIDMQNGETADVFFNTMAECSTEEEFIRKVQEQLQKYSSLSVDSSACSDNTADESLNSSEITEDDFEYDEAGSGISTKDYMGYTIYKSIPDEDSGSVGYMVYDGDYPQSFDTLEECKEFIRDTLNSSKKLNSASGKYQPDNSKGLYPDKALVNGEGSGTIEDDLPRAKRLFENWLTRAGSAYGIQLHLYTWYLADQNYGQGDVRRSLQVEFTDPEAEGDNSPVDYYGPNSEDFYKGMTEFLNTQLFPAIKKEEPTVDSVFIMGGPNGYQEYNLNSSKDSSKALNCSSEEPEGDADGGESVAEGVDASDIKITTESGNEVSMQDIKIVQNPDTNELAIFIPEDEEETIPEGFTVIGMVVPDAVGSTPAIEGGDVCPECGQDPCVCEEGSEDGGELDSSKKKSELNCSSSSGLLEVATEYYEYEHDALVDILQSVDNLGYGDAVYEQLIKNYGYEGTDAQQADEALIKMASEDADEHDFLVSLIQAIEDLGYGKQVYTDVLGIGGDINSSVNSSLGGGDDRQDATSQVTVPKSFPDDKVHDLYRWIETELMHEGIDVDVYSVGRPSAGVISFEFEVTGRDPAEVDAIIEDRVQEFVQNGYEGLQYPKGDPRHGLNSEKHEKNLNCKVENARVEPTEQGTWVVKADTDRFGKNAILYEHYSEEGANKYLDRLKAGGDAVANGYSGHIDPKKVDLDSSIKRDLEAVLATGDRDAIHRVVDDSGYGEKMMDAVGKFLFENGYSWEEDADAETWTVREDEGAGDLVGIIIDEDIANVNAEALVRNNLDWDKSVQDVCSWVVDQLGLPRS